MELLLTPKDKDMVNLNPKLTSLAEVLASLAGDTLVLATKDAPFVEYFISVMTQYTTPHPMELLLMIYRTTLCPLIRVHSKIQSHSGHSGSKLRSDHKSIYHAC